MSIFKKPEERTPKTTIAMMIYGMPSVGKTTLACSAPNSVIIDFENGLDRVNFAHQIPSVNPTSWEEVNAAIKDVRDHPEIKSVVVDSVDRLMDAALEHVRKINENLFQSDGTPTLKAYGVRKTLYQSFVKQLRDMGRNIIYVAHCIEDKKKVGRDEVTYYRPNISKTNAADITTDLDMEGFMFYYNGARVITFDPWGDIECKNSCNLHGKWDPNLRMYMPIEIPVIINSDGSTTAANDWLNRFFAFNTKRVQENFAKMKGESK